jgi:lysyl endopeptidase
MSRRHALFVALAFACAPILSSTAANAAEMGSSPVTALASPADTGTLQLAKSVPAIEVLRLAPPGDDELSALAARRRVQLKQGEPLEIGLPRDVAGLVLDARALPWQSALAGAHTARFSIVSQEARALRAGLSFALANARTPDALRRALDATTFRFADASGAAFEVRGTTISSDELYWTPAVRGEQLTVEIVTAAGVEANALRVGVVQLSHLDIDPGVDSDRAIGLKIGESDSCERDIVCRASPPSGFRSTADAVARMLFTKSGSSYLCTGTLLNNSNSPRKHLFWSANHCISTQSVANTLQTYWFYEATTCGGLTASSRRKTLNGGAFLRHNNSARDTLLLELKTTPPAGAVYAGWNSAAIGSTGTAIEGIHHPAGDVKMYSLGSVSSLSRNIDGKGPFYRVVWTTGVTEGGSSGSGLFTVSGGAYQLRGGLYGGYSFCSAPSDPDFYSRFADVWGSVSGYLNP